MAKKKTTKKATPRKKVGGSKAVTPQRRGVKPRKRRNTKAGLSEKSYGPPDDRTIKSPADGAPEVTLIRPSFNNGFMTFRPLPCWNPDEWEKIAAGPKAEYLDPYRMSQEPNDISDVMREYEAVSFWGDGDEAVTFCLYDKDWGDDYDSRENPAVIIWNSVYRAVKKEFSHPEWLKLIEGHRKTIDRPTTLTFMQALIFRHAGKLYVGKGKSPRGLGQRDKPHILQLKRSAGRAIKEMINMVNEEWTGDPDNFDKSMLVGDPFSPQHGRFITIYNPKKEQLGGESLDDLDTFEAGADDDGGVEGGGEDKFQGYSVRFDEKYMHNGKATKLGAKLEGKNLDVAMDRLVWLDDVIDMPSSCDTASIEEMHAKQCLMLAKALRGYKSVLEFAWADKPHFFDDEVKKVLANSVQVSLAGAIPDGEGDLNELEEWADGALETDAEPEKKPKRRRSKGVPTEEPEPVAEEDEYEEVAEDEDVGEEEDVEEDAEGDAEYEEVEEDAEGEEEEVAEGDDEDDEYEYVEEDAEEDAEGEEEEDEEDEEDEYEEVEEDAEGEEEEDAEGDDDADEYEEFDEEDGEEDSGEDDEYEDADEYEDPDDEDVGDEEYEDAGDEEGDEEPDEEEDADMKAAAEAAKARSGARGSKPTTKKKKAAGAPKKKTPKAKTPTKKAPPKKKAAPTKKAPAKKAPPKKKKTTKKKSS